LPAPPCPDKKVVLWEIVRIEAEPEYSE